jgi:glycosyltransferase involved in cell wall biosynthesis
MRIGFDAKRAYLNRSGLGNYSRDTIRALCNEFPHEDYYLYSPSFNNQFSFLHETPNVHLCKPDFSLNKLYGSFWRTFRLGDRLIYDKIEIFHGLSNELPVGLKNKRVRTVVTIHDLIFMRHPEWYKPFDRAIYRKKFFYSCKISDKVVTVSKQTKNDLMSFFGIPEEKIEVIYQGCNIKFRSELSLEQKKTIKQKWNLPNEFILYVGTVEERKNLLNIVKAMQQQKIDIPLVVVGRHAKYADKVKKYIRDNSITNIHFLKEVTVNDLPAIYQSAKLFVYPSLFEGFGIPILEALFSRVPVITSREGCFSEVGGDSALYINPLDIEELGNAILKVLDDNKLSASMRDSGFKQAQLFAEDIGAKQLMNLYKKLLHD